MMKKLLAVVVMAMMTAAIIDPTVAAAPDASREPKAQEAAEATPGDPEPGAAGGAAVEPAHEGTGVAAMEKAAKAKKYLFALFRNEENDQTAAMREVVKEAMKKLAARADSVEIDVTAASEKAIVDRFHLQYAPMPLLLAIAPNGVVTAGFTTTIEEQDLLEAFATPATEKCLKAFQDRKLAFLCIQNSKTKFSKEAMQGVREFARDERFAEDTEIIVIDPADAAEADLLKDLQIDPKTEEAITVFFMPPGKRIGEFRGATEVDELVATLVAAMSGCGCACGPGGCPPR